MNKISTQDLNREILNITKQLLIESELPYQRELKMEMSLQRHLNMDSLMRAEFFARIAKAFSISFSDQFLSEAETLQDVADYIQQASPQSYEVKPKGQIISSHGDRPHLNTNNATTLVDLLYIYGEGAADKAHIYFQHEDGKEEIITYGQLLSSALKIAYSLKALDLREGETVAIMLPTHPGFFYTFFGVLLAGGIPVPIYPPFRMHMLESYAQLEARILNNAEVRILITFEQVEKLGHLLKSFVPSLKYVRTFAELLQPQELSNPFLPTANHFAFIQYTSGSTSDPKGVLLNHYNLLANISSYGQTIHANENDVAVSWLPLYHDMGLIGSWLGSLKYGLPLVSMTPFSFLNHPEKWLWAIHYHRGTVSAAPNFAYELCIRKLDAAQLEGLDLSSWRIAANGAEKVYPKTLKDFAEKFTPYGLKETALYPVYGLAECTVALALPPLNQKYRVDHIDRKKFEEERLAIASTDKNALAFVACGKVIPGHEIRIVDKDNVVLAERQVGQLQFRGPSVMQGYFNNPKATASVYHDGWIDSGDLAYLADNEVFITGRRKDLIIKAGRNLYPAEIEELVGTIHGVRQGCVAAFASSDEKLGTEKMVIVAETRETNLEAQAKIRAAILESVNQALEIAPDEIILVKSHTVPKTSSGKLQRSACKKMYEEGKLAKFHAPPWLQIVRLSLQGFGHKVWALLKTLGKFFYTIYLGFFLLISIIPVYLLLFILPQHATGKLIRYWMRFLHIVSLCPLQVNGRNNLVKDKPVIYAVNHASYIDPLVLLTLLPPDTKFIGKKELLNVPIVRTFIKKLNYLVVHRMDLSKGIEDTKLIGEILQQGHSVVIFPEGTFGYAQGLRPFRLGAFKVAVENGFPVCPIALAGTRNILRDDHKLFQPGKIKVTICPPIQAAGNNWQDVTQLRNVVRAEIAKYCGEPSLDFIAALTVAPKPKNRKH